MGVWEARRFKITGQNHLHPEEWYSPGIKLVGVLNRGICLSKSDVRYLESGDARSKVVTHPTLLLRVTELLDRLYLRGRSMADSMVIVA